MTRRAVSAGSRQVDARKAVDVPLPYAGGLKLGRRSLLRGGLDARKAVEVAQDLRRRLNEQIESRPNSERPFLCCICADFGK